MSNATIHPNIDTKLSKLIEYLQSYKCVIIYDDMQMLFSSGKLAGEYQDNYENYAIFWQKIATGIHQSCLILNTWEKPREIAKLETENNRVNCLFLDSLGIHNQEFLKSQNLLDDDQWDILITNYQGNPLWLKFTVMMIKELCLGKVGEFLQYGNVILSPDLQSKLNQQFNRLTEYEKLSLSY